MKVGNYASTTMYYLIQRIGNWISTNSKTISETGRFVGYIKDSNGAINTCSATVSSKTQYRSRNCKNSNKTFGTWWTSSWGYTTIGGCTAVSQEYAENNYSTFYRTCFYPSPGTDGHTF